MDDDLAIRQNTVTDNSEYFTTLELTQRLDLIRHLIDNIEIIPLIRGPFGIGKSLFAARIRQLAPINWSVCLFEADAAMSPERLLSNIARSFGWTDLQGDLLEGVTRCCEAMREEGQLPVILLDDAQLLPPASLIALLRLFERQREGEPLVSIVLFADEQIELLLSMPQLRIMTPQAIQIIDLPPLNREDATGFMYFLLKREGLPIDLNLDHTRLTRFYRETKGNPGPLGHAIIEAFSAGSEGGKGGDSKRLRLMFFSMLCALVLSSIFVYQDQINQLFLASQQPDDTAIPISERPLQATGDAGAQLQQAKPAQQVLEKAVVVAPLLPAPGLVRELDLSEHEQGIDSPSLPMVVTLGKHGGTLEVEQPQAKLEIDEAEKIQQVAEIEPIEAYREVPVSALPIAPSTGTEAMAQSQVEWSVDKPESEITQAVESRPVKEPPPPSPDPMRVSSVPADPMMREEWILTRPADHYTLQLLGVERLQALKEFVRRHGLQAEAFYYATRRKGKPWHPLLWGDFPDKKSAIKSVQQLPSKVQRNGYWIRTFGDLQTQIKKRKNP